MASGKEVATYWYEYPINPVKPWAGMLQKPHVAKVCFKCFRGMLQALYINVAKVDRDVAHVVMAIHVSFKCMFQMFHLF